MRVRVWVVSGILFSLLCLAGLSYALIRLRAIPTPAEAAKPSTPHAGHADPKADPLAATPTAMPGMAMPPPAADQPKGYTEITIAPDVQQRVGVKTGQAVVAPLKMTVRTVGIVRPDETRVTRVHLKTQGWITQVNVSFVGQKVRAGDPLLSIYSPDFVSAQEEYLRARRMEKANPSTAEGSRALAEMARRRLELWDVPPAEITEIEQTGRAKLALVLRSRIAGTVLERKAFEGQYVKPEDELFVVADLSTVWVQAKVYEYELPHVRLQEAAAVTTPALPDQTLSGKIAFVAPVVEEETRTAQVRIDLPNPNGTLRPGMFCQIVFTHPMEQGVIVPTSAVLRTGERNIAFVVHGQDRFMPVLVDIEPLPYGDNFHVTNGLNAGDVVVTSANFLVDSESRLRAGGGAGSMAGMPGMPGMGGTSGKADGSMPGIASAPEPTKEKRTSLAPTAPTETQGAAPTPPVARDSNENAMEGMPGMDGSHDTSGHGKNAEGTDRAVK